MTIIIVLCFVFIVGALLERFGRYALELAGVLLMLAAGFIGLMVLVTVPVNRMEVRAGIQRVEAVRASRQMLTGTTNLEVAAWRVKVADVNADLAEMQYYNSTVFDIWIPDEVEAVEAIQ